MPLSKPCSPSSQSEEHTSSSALYVIGIYKLFEASLLAAAGFGALKLLHSDIGEVLEHWVRVLRIDPENHYVHLLIGKAFSVDEKELRALSVGTFLYSALRLGEGIGLVLRKRWGEYLTVIATALFIPLEVWELARHFTWIKVAVFVANVAILIYLAAGLKKPLPGRNQKAVTVS
jgi:uncharacterized membrane protein (DUF2068 family)